MKKFIQLFFIGLLLLSSLGCAEAECSLLEGEWQLIDFTVDGEPAKESIGMGEPELVTSGVLEFSGGEDGFGDFSFWLNNILFAFGTYECRKEDKMIDFNSEEEWDFILEGDAFTLCSPESKLEFERN